MTLHHGVPINVDTMCSLPDQMREEFYAFYGVVWKRFWPILNNIYKADRARELAAQAARNRDRPSRWWPLAGAFREVAIRDDGSLWNPNGYVEADVRAAIARPKLASPSASKRAFNVVSKNAPDDGKNVSTPRPRRSVRARASGDVCTATAAERR
jgi:hypothetical protein